MPDRLNELVRQRALMLEHLAWLDREIAAAQTATPVASPPTSSPVVAAPVVEATATSVPPHVPQSLPEATTAGAPADPEALLEQFRVEPSAMKQDLRKGCLLYFAGAFAVVGIVIAILYFTIGTR